MFDFLLVYGKGPLGEDLLDQFREQPVWEASFVYREARFLLSQDRKRFALFCASDAEAHLAVSEQGVDFFDGILMQDEAVVDIRALAPILSSGESDHAAVFGNYCFGHFSETGENHVHGTVLGYYPLFAGAAPGYAVISNNPTLAAQALHGARFTGRKNIQSLAWVSLTGAIADLSTPFDEVYRVPQNAGVVIDSRNNVAFYEQCRDFYHPMTKDEWDGRLRATHEQLLRYVAAYCKSGAVTGDITGGYDSRVTLALAIQAGVHQSIPYQVLGSDTHPDVIVARQIAARYGLRLEVARARADSDAVIEAAYYDTLTRHHNAAGMVSFVEQWLHALSAHRAGPHRTVMSSLGGASNEMFRGYFSLHHLLEGGLPNRPMTGRDREFLLGESIALSALRPGARDSFRESLLRVFNSFEDLYSYDLLYMRARQPQFHGGLWFKTETPHACFVGYNTWLHRLAMIEPPEMRASIDLMFKLIEASEPGLLFFPFAGKRWPRLAFAGHPQAERIRRIKPVFNRGNVPLPSASNAERQMRFVQRAAPGGLRFHESLSRVYDARSLERVAAESASGRNGIWTHVNALCLHGISLFMENRDTAPLRLLAPAEAARLAATPLRRECAPALLADAPLYAVSGDWYREDATAVLQMGDLFFARKRFFAAADHNALSPKTQAAFNRRQRVTGLSSKLKRTIKAVSPDWLLDCYRKVRSAGRRAR